MDKLSNANGKNILLVDDDRLVLVTLASGLAGNGYHVYTAESVDDAEVILAAGDRIDLAIIDVSMPQRNGLELAERLRSFDHVPFIFLSAYSDQVFVDQASAYGALSYLVKPIDPVQMIPVVKAALDRAEELRSLKNYQHDLQSALDKDRDISVATGITMHQHNLNRKEAFELLRKTSRGRRCKLDVLAKEIIASIGAAKDEFPAINKTRLDS